MRFVAIVNSLTHQVRYFIKFGFTGSLGFFFGFFVHVFSTVPSNELNWLHPQKTIPASSNVCNIAFSGTIAGGMVSCLRATFVYFCFCMCLPVLKRRTKTHATPNQNMDTETEKKLETAKFWVTGDNYCCFEFRGIILHIVDGLCRYTGFPWIKHDQTISWCLVCLREAQTILLPGCYKGSEKHGNKWSFWHFFTIRLIRLYIWMGIQWDHMIHLPISFGDVGETNQPWDFTQQNWKVWCDHPRILHRKLTIQKWLQKRCSGTSRSSVFQLHTFWSLLGCQGCPFFLAIIVLDFRAIRAF